MGKNKFDLQPVGVTAVSVEPKQHSDEPCSSSTGSDQGAPAKPHTTGYGEIKDTSLRVSTGNLLPKIVSLDFNPRVTFFSIIFIWAFIVWCMLDDGANDTFLDWRSWVTENFTWLYIGSQDVWAVFLIVLYFSKYSNLKLGKDDDEPEFSTVSWFTMLFSCGVAVGLFFFGVSEPVWHYDPSGGGSRYINDPNIQDNTLAQIAMNITFYHWGIHAWVVYCLVGCLLGLVCYREGLPMTIKSCFYPLLGDRIFGWLGDFIDVVSIVTTLFGVCTSLGLGVMQLNTGLNILNSDIEIKTLTQVIIIWAITCIATLSTLSGIKIGIRRISEVCFSFGMFIMIVAFLLGKPFYLLNVFVQSTGYYLQWVIQLGFHCDAFEMLGGSFGSEDRGREVVDQSSDGPSSWMDWWTIFYWGWWIAWSPFVGMFMAKISRGRTIREFINGSMTAPILYSFLWFSIFGGSGIAMERSAAERNYCCTQNFASNLSHIESHTPGNVTTANMHMFCEGDACNICATHILTQELGKSLESLQDEIENSPGQFTKSRSKDKKYVRLSCYSKEEMWFYLMESYGDLGTFLDVFSMMALVLYFVTSSDSGSYVIDCLAANGDEESPRLQRVFWALTEGAAATALIIAGGKDSLDALQTISIVAGLPYTIIICFMCVALWRCCRVSYGDLDPNAPDFKVGFFDFCTIFTLNCKAQVFWMASIALGPWWCASAACKVWGFSVVHAVIFAAMMYLELLCFAGFYLLQLEIDGAWALAWTFYCGFAFCIAASRTAVRTHFKYIGNPIEDFLAGFLLYPSVGAQLQGVSEDFEDPVLRRETQSNLKNYPSKDTVDSGISKSDAAITNFDMP